MLIRTKHKTAFSDMKFSLLKNQTKTSRIQCNTPQSPVFQTPARQTAIRDRTLLIFQSCCSAGFRLNLIMIVNNNVQILKRT